MAVHRRSTSRTKKINRSKLRTRKIQKGAAIGSRSSGQHTAFRGSRGFFKTGLTTKPGTYRSARANARAKSLVQSMEMQPRFTNANIEGYRNAALKEPTGYDKSPIRLSTKSPAHSSKFNNLTTYGEQSGTPKNNSSGYSRLQRSSNRGSTGINPSNSGMYSTLRTTTHLPNSGFYSVFE